VFERTFDAPRSQVWNAFTDPEIIPRWWGWHGTTTTVVEMVVRPGGKWEIREQRARSRGRDVLRRIPGGRATRAFRVDLHVRRGGRRPDGRPGDLPLRDLGGKTKVTSVGHFDSVESIDGALASGMVRGAIETWDRLEAYLSKG
jgi:hypothetical protein